MNSFEIARLAGVSRSTVTRVINNYGNVHPKTKSKVLKVMEEYNYRPNATAKKLSSKKSNVVGLLVIKDIDQSSPSFLADAFFGPMIDTIIHSASKRGYRIMLDIKEENDKNILNLFHDKSIDAGIFLSWSNLQPTLHEAADLGYHCGVIDFDFAIERDDSIVVMDVSDKQSAYKATKYLIDLGHQHIGFITGIKSKRCSIERLEGYKSAHLESGLEVNECDIYEGFFNEVDGNAAVEKWMETGKLPTAIFAANDKMAIGALNALHKKGIRVPEDVSVIGYDDVILSQYTSPKLSTMKVPVSEMAHNLIHTLIDKLEGKEGVQKRRTFIAELVERESTAKLRKMKKK
ncbi:LacI family DNA-binding transcriptional regulator [Chengkuizengella axinellae]|uniref:LacI family DNA-binding transcriptional regulator n=1 Tax=Chengkuizengella axinellae TaxID=3064388 RepID=A0ABT9IVM5_9BACL|nr:LacI family DNA-binding transcriptional regulator [Chengkuizengella sp. 2205SS18-9]MDP5273393.1 LacI family DNA-binding transcriptional regulator [Chengkuizengella sp. 2205SS18-9]